MTNWLEKKGLHLKGLTEKSILKPGNSAVELWGLLCIILSILAFLSPLTYLKSLGLAGILTIYFYFFFFRESTFKDKLKKLQEQRYGYFSSLECLEKASLLFLTEEDRNRLVSFLEDFFSQLLRAQSPLVFLKEENSYRLFNLAGKARFKRRSIKADDPLIKLLKSQSACSILNLVEPGETQIRSSFSGIEFRSVLSLKIKDDLVGLVLFTSDKKSLSEEEKRALHLVSCRLWWLLETRGLKRKLQGKKGERINKLSRKKLSVPLSEAEFKRKIFDLHSLLQAANQLYLSLEQNRLFYNFIQILQRQLSSKSVAIFLPQPEEKRIKAIYSKGIDFHQFSDLGIGEKDPLYEKFRQQQKVFYLYQMIEEYQGNELLARLIAQGLQICYPLKLPDNKLGLVFLGGKTEGLRYKKEEDFLILNFLGEVLNVSLKNINHYKSLEELSYTDSLSGLYNYRYFCKRLNEEIFRAKRYQRKLALVIFDIDEFKTYNDSFGHQSGDRIIKQLGEEIAKVVRSIDVVCRYGGDEFCIIMPETEQEECLKFIERLRKHIHHHTFVNDFLQLKHHLSLSAGAAIYPQHARTFEKLIYYADMALLKAKSSGRNKAFIHSGEEMALKSTGSIRA